MRRDIQHQRRFAYPWIATQEDKSAGHNASAENAIELRYSRRHTRCLDAVDFGEWDRR
jgi:hypothetical protein